MSFEIIWQQACVVHIRFYGDDMDASVEQSQHELERELAEIEGKVHIIIDLSAVTQRPPSLAKVRQQVFFEKSEKLGYSIFVIGTNPIIRYFASILAPLLLKGRQFTVVDSLNEALRYLHERDELVTLEDAKRQND